jgi:hypothetical protein
MKKIFTFFLCIIVLRSQAQVMCGTASEGSSLVLTAPPGAVFSKLTFASYGTPDGVCGGYTLGGCSSVSSWSVCSTAIMGKNSFVIDANNVVFGDPCPGIPKRLYVEAVYSYTLPVKLVSFIVQKIEGAKARISWETDSEEGSSHFIVERSVDGNQFYEAGRVDAAGTGHDYNFINSLSAAATHFYRLKMVDIDGRFEYSNIVKVGSGAPLITLSAYPSPVSSYLTVNSTMKTEAYITNITGQKVKVLSLVNGSQTVNVQDWQPGVYYVSAGEVKIRFVKM